MRLKAGSVLSVSVTPIELPLHHPFTIARGEELVASTAVVRLRGRSCVGLGEATPIERYGESVESVVAYFASHALASDDPYHLETLLHSGIPPAARAGLDLALHDLIGKELGKPLYALLGLDPAASATTSFTIGIADPRDDAAKTRRSARLPNSQDQARTRHAGRAGRDDRRDSRAL